MGFKLINKDSLAKIISTGFFVGYAPVAPGTCGSFFALALYFLLTEYLSFDNISILNIHIPSFILYLFLLTFLFLVGVWTATRCESFWGKDPGKVVIDEVVGMLITIGFMPLNFTIMLAGFFIFRAFDIFKPPPIRLLEKLPGGWGIMADDVLAGVYANIVLRLIIYYVPFVKV